jgi:hypothetical protein
MTDTDDCSFITQDFDYEYEYLPNLEKYLLYNLMSIQPLCNDLLQNPVARPLIKLDDRLLAVESMLSDVQSQIQSLSQRVDVLEKKLAPKPKPEPGTVADFGLSQKRRSSKEEKNNVLKLLELKGDSPYVNVDGVKVDLS